MCMIVRPTNWKFYLKGIMREIGMEWESEGGALEEGVAENSLALLERPTGIETQAREFIDSQKKVWNSYRCMPKIFL